MYRKIGSNLARAIYADWMRRTDQHLDYQAYDRAISQVRDSGDMHSWEIGMTDAPSAAEDAQLHVLNDTHYSRVVFVLEGGDEETYRITFHASHRLTSRAAAHDVIRDLVTYEDAKDTLHDDSCGVFVQLGDLRVLQAVLVSEATARRDD
jgi:hypothetical protein